MTNYEQQKHRTKKFLRRAGLVVSWLFAVLLIPSHSHAATQNQYGVIVSWDRSSSPAVESYRIYYGPSSRNYTNSLTTGNVTTYTVLGLVPGVTYFFAATAITTNGLESAFSDEITFKPGQPDVELHAGTDGQPVLKVSGMIDHTYEVQATVDFQTWTAIGTVTLTGSTTMDFTDTSAAGFAQRFYRTQEIP